MIIAFTGTPGSGKTYDAVGKLIENLKKSGEFNNSGDFVEKSLIAEEKYRLQAPVYDHEQDIRAIQAANFGIKP